MRRDAELALNVPHADAHRQIRRRRQLNRDVIGRVHARAPRPAGVVNIGAAVRAEQLAQRARVSRVPKCEELGVSRVAAVALAALELPRARRVASGVRCRAPRGERPLHTRAHRGEACGAVGDAVKVGDMPRTAAHGILGRLGEFGRVQEREIDLSRETGELLADDKRRVPVMLRRQRDLRARRTLSLWRRAATSRARSRSP